MAPGVPHRVGVYFALVQLLFTLTWTIYVIFLPRLAAQVGIPKQWVVYILLADQLIFVDHGFHDGGRGRPRVAGAGQARLRVLGVTLVSCLVFLLLPFVAPQGAPWLFLLVTVLWAMSSSALRAPPFTLLGKYAPKPSMPWLSGLSLFGLGRRQRAFAVSRRSAARCRSAPAFRGIQHRARAGNGRHHLGRAHAGEADAVGCARACNRGHPAEALAAGDLVLRRGAARRARLSNPLLAQQRAACTCVSRSRADLEHLMPVFWIGFSLLMLPASLATKRYGGVAVAAFGRGDRGPRLLRQLHRRAVSTR